MNAPVVTAVGRRLKPRNGEPRKLHIIAVATSGQVRTLVNREIPPRPET